VAVIINVLSLSHSWGFSIYFENSELWKAARKRLRVVQPAKNCLIVGALVTWAIYTQRQLQLWSSVEQVKPRLALRQRTQRTSSCEQRVKPGWQWRCGGFSELHVHAVFPSALVFQPGVALLGGPHLHLICLGVVARKFCHLTLVSLFAQASRSQEDTQESTTHLLKLDACGRAILLTSVGVCWAGYTWCISTYPYIYVHIYIHIYVYTYMHIYMYIYLHKNRW